MNRIEFIQRTARSAGHASGFSTQELFEHRRHQGLTKAALKTAYARTVGALIAHKIEVDDEVYRILSGGSEQIVYANEENVAKIVVGSLTFDKQEASAHVAHLEADYETVEPHLGEHLAITAYTAKRFRGGLFAALALQPRLRADKEFLNVDEMVTYRDDEAYADELRSLFDSLTGLYHSEGWQMDLNGRNNLFLISGDSAPNIKIVDTMVVTPEMQAIVDRTMSITNGDLMLAHMSKIRAGLAPVFTAAS